MKKYIGVKIVEAAPMTLGHYNDYKGWTIPADEDPNREGYRVHYSDGYVSWSPKEIFEETNKELFGLPFGTAVAALKNFIPTTRAKWPHGTFIFAQVPSLIDGSIVPKMTSLPDSVKKEFAARFDRDHVNAQLMYKNQIALVDPDNNICAWIPTIEDLFATDWCILD